MNEITDRENVSGIHPFGMFGSATQDCRPVLLRAVALPLCFEFQRVSNSELIRILTLKKMSVEINEVKFFNRTGKCGVQPAVIIMVEHIFHQVTMVDKNRVPLSALRFVAG